MDSVQGEGESPDFAPTRIKLPGSGRTSEAAALHSRMLHAAETDASVEIDASAVETLGQATLQLLLALRRHVVERGQIFAITQASDAFVDQVGRCGLLAEVGISADGRVSA